MTKDILAEICPAAFTTRPSSLVSDRYEFASSLDVVNQMYDSGWQATSAIQSGASEFNHHVIRFRDTEAKLLVGDVAQELVLENSHDRSSRRILRAGLFRLTCANGATIPLASGMAASQKHNTPVRFDIEAVLGSFGPIMAQVLLMQHHHLTDVERHRFAKRAVALRFGPEIAVDYPTEVLLEPRRMVDKAKDVWTTFNVVQENFIRGGVGQIRGTTNPRLRMALNLGLFTLAEEALGWN